MKSIENNAFLSFASFIQEAEITENKCQEYMDIGWLQPVNEQSDNKQPKKEQPEKEELQFNTADILKIRKAERLCKDFELPCHAGAMIVDLLERIDNLESQLAQYKK